MMNVHDRVGDVYLVTFGNGKSRYYQVGYAGDTVFETDDTGGRLIELLLANRNQTFSGKDLATRFGTTPQDLGKWTRAIEPQFAKSRCFRLVRENRPLRLSLNDSHAPLSYYQGLDRLDEKIGWRNPPSDSLDSAML